MLLKRNMKNDSQTPYTAILCALKALAWFWAQIDFWNVCLEFQIHHFAQWEKFDSWYRLCSIHAKPQWFRRFGYVDELISKDLAKNKDTIDDGLGELLVKFYTKRRKKHRNSNTRFASPLSNCYAEKVSLFEVCLFKQKVTSFTLFKP